MPQQRATNYFKLYTDFMPFQTCLLVAHRHFVSTYSFADEVWQDTFKFDQWVNCFTFNLLETPESDVDLDRSTQESLKWFQKRTNTLLRQDTII